MLTSSFALFVHETLPQLASPSLLPPTLSNLGYLFIVSYLLLKKKNYQNDKNSLSHLSHSHRSLSLLGAHRRPKGNEINEKKRQRLFTRPFGRSRLDADSVQNENDLNTWIPKKKVRTDRRRRRCCHPHGKKTTKLCIYQNEHKNVYTKNVRCSVCWIKRLVLHALLFLVEGCMWSATYEVFPRSNSSS